jgi:hypothetical protein
MQEWVGAGQQEKKDRQAIQDNKQMAGETSKFRHGNA